jgi:cyclase
MNRTFQLALAGFLLTGAVVAQTPAAAPANAARPAQNFDNVQVHILPVQGNVYMLVGAGGNIAVQVGKDGVLLVDTSFAPMADKILAAIKTLSDKPIQYIINTHVHPDHIGGNEKLAKAGKSIVGGNFAANVGQEAASSANIIAHENVMNRMSAKTGETSPTPSAAWPTDTYFTASKDMFFNGEAIQLFHEANAHTDGDSLVFFRRSDVVVAGDIFTPAAYPFIDLARGGNIQGIVKGLNHIIDLTVPADKQEGGTYVIPGHGRLCDEADVVEYRDMVTIVRDRIQDMVKKGMTLAQVKEAKPTRDYDPLYAPENPAATDRFVEGVYNSLAAKK